VARKCEGGEETLRQHHIVDHATIDSPMGWNNQLIKGLVKVGVYLSVDPTVRLDKRDLKRCIKRVMYIELNRHEVVQRNREEWDRNLHVRKDGISGEA